MSRCLLLIAAFVLVTPLYAGEAKIKTEKKIVYGKGDDVELELDLAMPATGDGPFPAIVCIHGGGWRAGSRQQLDTLTREFAKNNFVAITV
ncbi:MAG TPA: alpha/beta hydrolase, partial [Gemmataceae bacterium]|nr:alpha/beta hydrolase [Gemmataceae bacterium]